jgi:hypothetical protein
MSRKIWHCPYCKMSSSRHWNVKRHIYTKHNGVGEPVYNHTNYSSNAANIKAFNTSYTYPHYSNDSSGIPKSFHKGYDFADTLINFMRKMVEFKSLLIQLQPPFTPPVGSPNFAYQNLSPPIFNDVYQTIYTSMIFQKPFPPNSWITTGLKALVCPKCLKEVLIPTFFKIEGKEEIFEPQHECIKASLYTMEETEQVLKTGNINLTKQMSKIIKAWLLGENCIIWAKEIKQHYSISTEGININQKDDWPARAIRDKFTELKDDNELMDFLAKTNNSTSGIFKIYSSQNSSPKFYLFMIIKQEWCNC